MSRYAIRHNPAVQARTLAEHKALGLPVLNDQPLKWWRQKATDLGLPAKGTKRDIYTRVLLYLRNIQKEP